MLSKLFLNMIDILLGFQFLDLPRFFLHRPLHLSLEIVKLVLEDKTVLCLFSPYFFLLNHFYERMFFLQGELLSSWRFFGLLHQSEVVLHIFLLRFYLHVLRIHKLRLLLWHHCTHVSTLSSFLLKRQLSPPTVLQYLSVQLGPVSSLTSLLPAPVLLHIRHLRREQRSWQIRQF